MSQLALDFADLEEEHFVLERSVTVCKFGWDHRTIERTTVPKDFLERIQATYSADRLLDDPATLRGTFEHDGSTWFCVGVVFSDQGGYCDACRIVPADLVRGWVSHAKKHGYHGQAVTRKGERFVIAAERRRFVPIKPPTLFGDTA